MGSNRVIGRAPARAELLTQQGLTNNLNNPLFSLYYPCARVGARV